MDLPLEQLQFGQPLVVPADEFDIGLLDGSDMRYNGTTNYLIQMDIPDNEKFMCETVEYEFYTSDTFYNWCIQHLPYIHFHKRYNYFDRSGSIRVHNMRAYCLGQEIPKWSIKYARDRKLFFKLSPKYDEQSASRASRAALVERPLWYVPHAVQLDCVIDPRRMVEKFD